MWYPSTETEATIVEAVTLAEAQDQCNAPEADFVNILERQIKAARGHCELYCNVRFAQRTVIMQCSSFSDFSRLPEAPLSEVQTIEYVDINGADQVVNEAVYEAHKDGLEPSIALRFSQSWPRTRFGSRIAVTAVVGGNVPDEVKHAMLLFIDDAFNKRANAKIDDWTALDALLCNHRRGA